VSGRDVQPILEQVLQSSGTFQAVGSFISELALAPGPGPEPPAANELGGGPVRHVRLTELERLAGPSAPGSATPHAEFDLTPRIS